jgi:hypothetical protein
LLHPKCAVSILRLPASLAGVILPMWLLHVSAALAEDVPPVELTWSATEGCPTRESVLSEVAREVGPRGKQAAGVIARAVVTQDERGLWRSELVVEIGAAHGERLLEAQSCEGVASAAALIIAIAVETGAPPASPKAPAPVPVPVPVPVPPPVVTAAARPPQPPPRPPAPVDSPHRNSKLLLALAGVVDSGTLPSLSPGLEASLGGSYGTSIWRGRITAAGAYFAPETAGVTDGARPGEGGRFTLLTLSGRACVSRTVSTFDLGPCLGGEVDAMSGEGVDSKTTTTGHGRWAALSGSLLGAWHPIGPLAVFLRLDAIVPLARPSFVLQEPSTDISVHSPASISPRAALGIELRFF